MSRALLLLAVIACAEVAPQTPTRPRDTTQLAKIEASTDLDGAVVGKATGATIVVVFASWCQHCHRELDVIAQLRPAYPQLRVLGVNYKGHEEYDGRGSSTAVRRYLTEHAPWLRVVPADDPLFDLLGRPRLIPTLYVFNRAGELVTTYSRTDRAMPDGDELRELLRRIGT
jgi:thiol-disulfide isomerase/thioredoxin